MFYLTPLWLQAKTLRHRFRRVLRDKLQDDRALGTVEIVLIIAILIAIALIFRKQLMGFAEDLFARVFDHSVIDGVEYDLGQ